MKDRLKEIRKNHPNGGTQDSFAKFLGISKSNLASYESGRRTPSEGIVQLFCQKCGVNEEWLTDGIGEMKKTTDRKLSGYLSEIATGDDEFIQNLIEVYMELDQTSKEALKEIAKKMAEKQKKSRD